MRRRNNCSMAELEKQMIAGLKNFMEFNLQTPIVVALKHLAS
jgi:hypothetical protein